MEGVFLKSNSIEREKFSTLQLLARASLVMAVALVMLLVYAPGVLAHGSAHKPATQSLPQATEQMPWGVAGSPAAVVRTVQVRMGDDMRFSPQTLRVKLGDTLRIRVSNTGKLLHEFVIGTPEENAKHAELMMKFPGMEHDAPYMAHVAPGQEGEIIWRFNTPGQFEFACLIAGHYQAGMVGTIHVQAN